VKKRSCESPASQKTLPVCTHPKVSAVLWVHEAKMAVLGSQPAASLGTMCRLYHPLSAAVTRKKAA
jgi:hypothetical protein